MLSKTAEYALRSIVYIALHAAKNKNIGIKEIAQELELPQPFMGKILQDLVRKNVIASVKGPHGGFFLKHSAKSITIMDVVRAIDGIEMFKRCGLGLEHCSDTHPCPLHQEFKKYRDGLAEVFSQRTIQDLVLNVENSQAYIKNKNQEPGASDLTF